MDFYDQERNAPVVKKKTNRKAATAEKQRRENQEEVFPCQACRKLLQPALKLLRWKRRIRKKFWSIVLFSSSGQVIFVKQTNKKQFSKRSKINHKEPVGKKKKGNEAYILPLSLLWYKQETTVWLKQRGRKGWCPGRLHKPREVSTGRRTLNPCT